MAVRAADYRAVQGGRHLEIKITEAEKGKEGCEVYQDEGTSNKMRGRDRFFET